MSSFVYGALVCLDTHADKYIDTSLEYFVQRNVKRTEYANHLYTMKKSRTSGLTTEPR